ncbi:MAG: hypothetical protein J0L70_26590 [Leptolyngbya sp. UWPOB_LEPTO1]|uniref:hypothetical protein n=1 Tax=Leptolyngbya sp. UWPOB_LEPTO1 TaxID=2815653 RepID=UPI001AC31C47|nr:hypothetical protein [Leptolyngbya sp. UWPOB_LEPTO1]MBN8564109.1 hypothetical protein [Leptolyngbya sp. UWPOB_LEPTO1]
MQQIKQTRIHRFSFETYAALGAAIVVLIGVILQRMGSVPKPSPKPQTQPSIETVLYQAEAKRLLAEAFEQNQTRGTGCYQRGTDCVLAKMRREAIAQLEANYASNSSEALAAYIRLRAINTIPTLQQLPELDALEQFIHTQRRAK